MNCHKTQPLILSVNLPKYHLKKEPDYFAFGKAIDEILERNFLGKTVVVRGITLADHPEKMMDEMVSQIIETGTDKYDAERIPFWDAFPEYKGKGIELFAGKEFISKDYHSSHDLIENFFKGAEVDRGYGIRLDVITVYDPEQLEMIPIHYAESIGEDAWKFKYPEHKEKAVLAVLKIL